MQGSMGCLKFLDPLEGLVPALPTGHMSHGVSDSQSLRPLWPSACAASPRINVVGVVENAIRAFSTTPTTSG